MNVGDWITWRTVNGFASGAILEAQGDNFVIEMSNGKGMLVRDPEKPFKFNYSKTRK